MPDSGGMRYNSNGKTPIRSPLEILKKGFSKLNMNNQKVENKSTDHEEGDHTQPINLVASRTVAPTTTFTGANTCLAKILQNKD
ncbi:hypothetical protein TNCV_4232821 [Trichonephila clavipes]|nr:hypothetical protein TNCV_4232821 [Trichonephila clavipes]